MIVSDIAMPEMDGYDLLREVRRLPAEDGGSSPAIALSAYVSAEDRRQAAAAGFSEQVPKPVKMRDLVDAIARLAADGGASVAGPLTAVPTAVPRAS